MPFSNNHPRFPAARAILQQAIDQQAFPGAAWGVLHHNKILILEAEGRFTYQAASPNVQPHTLYDLASVTKVVATTALAMLLYDRGQLQLEALLGDILPGFVIGAQPGSGKDQVTLRHLLAHSSGLPGYGRLFEQHHTPQSMLHAALNLPLKARPGTRAEYSDIGFILLGKAIEVLAQENIAPLFAKEIAAPLGLKTTRYCPQQDQQKEIPPTEEDTSFRHRILQGEVQDENCYALGGAAGHAGLFSNAEDVLRFAQCILNHGKTEASQQLFQPETVKLFATKQTEPANTSRALGWDTPSQPSSSGSHFSAGSIGHLGYAGTSLWIDPEKNLAVVLLTNRTWPHRGSKAIQQVRPAFHDAITTALESASSL